MTEKRPCANQLENNIYNVAVVNMKGRVTVVHNNMEWICSWFGTRSSAMCSYDPTRKKNTILVEFKVALGVIGVFMSDTIYMYMHENAIHTCSTT